MSDNLHHSWLLAELPFDMLLKVLNKYNVNGVLDISAISTHLSGFTLVPDYTTALG